VKLRRRGLTPPSIRQRFRAAGVALATWYFVVASCALHVAVEEWLPRGARDEGCVAQRCCCGSPATCKMRCCCAPPTPAAKHAGRARTPATVAWIDGTDCPGDGAETGHALPLPGPALLPSLELVLPRRLAPPRAVAIAPDAPRLRARAPEKVPIGARNG
jgi:hypothetical protein